MKKLIVEFSGGTLNVADMDGNHCQGLTIGEVIEQITHMHYRGELRFPMKTSEEWNEEYEERQKNRITERAPLPF